MTSFSVLIFARVDPIELFEEKSYKVCVHMPQRKALFPHPTNRVHYSRHVVYPHKQGRFPHLSRPLVHPDGWLNCGKSIHFSIVASYWLLLPQND